MSVRSATRGKCVVEAVIFDLDGVIVDSEPVWERVRRQVVTDHGGRWLPDAQQRLMGMSTAEWSRYLSGELGVGLAPEAIAAAVIDRMSGHYRDRVPLMTGAGLLGLFAAAVSTEQVARGKPAPDVYLAVVDRLGFRPDRCAAVEDSTNGLRSAAAAGLHVIAVPHKRYPPDPAALDAAGLVLTRLADLTVDAVCQLAAE